MDVMVDIETTGTDPCHSVVLQISAVAFDYKQKTIDTSAFFDRCLGFTPGRFWDEGARNWWLGDPKREAVLMDLLKRQEDPATVMAQFASWLDERGSVRLWAKPLSFESPFLESYFKQFGIANRFNYSESMDLNSYIEARGHHRRPFWAEIPFEGEEHNALCDVLHQIKGAFLA